MEEEGVAKNLATDMDVVIVGGGLGGLALAVGLQERGIRAHVFEKTPTIRKHSGTAISLAANGLRALDGVKPGLAARMISEGAHITHFRAFGRVDGEPAKEVITPCQPGLMCMIPWKTAQQTLAEKVRGPDVSGEITKAYAADLEAHGPNVRKVRALRQMEGLEDMQHMVEAMQATHPDMVREARQVDRKPLTSWSNPSKVALLIGDAAHAMYPGPGEGARTSFEDAHQLCNVLGEVFFSPPVTSLEDAVTRIQAYAVERTYWLEYILNFLQNLTDAEKAQRSKEYMKWVLQYPECMLGDPESIY